MVWQLPKRCSLQCFHEEICYHVGRWATFDPNTFRIDLILNEKIPDEEPQSHTLPHHLTNSHPHAHPQLQATANPTTYCCTTSEGG
jgi:hypothetical protein